MSANPTLLGVQIAERLVERIEAAEVSPCMEAAPAETKPDHLLYMLHKLIDRANADEWPDTKIHRWLGFVMGCLTAHGICTVTCLKDMTADSKKYFDEVDDEDLKLHNDPDSPFRFDIGGEG